MKKILNHLFEHKTLSREEARDVLVAMSEGKYNESELAAFITVYLMRSITIDELLGFRDALLSLAVKVDLKEPKVMDIVGTGGDGKNTFNISTLACFIVAGTGKKVAKHGNYGASSISGSSNVMEQLGYRFTNDVDRLRKELATANICFLHAPLFHPALKVVGPIRKNLGVRTFFNMLGPLVNPASPETQLIGVYSLEMARIYNYVLQNSGRAFTIIHGLDGYDEISLTNDTKVITEQGEKIYSPRELGKRLVIAEDLSGGATLEEAAGIFRNVISGNGTWAQNAVVLANAAMALMGTGEYTSYDDAYQHAVESLESGAAQQSLEKLLSLQP
ncbi:MAG: anthranilate phosphoribosyltransferase [Chitinophagaceae bacterium]|jgi:anthranilate phosphoribosyltransferase|nr:anthranilate phosphoribosyltransferase [Chitinophagaceae bacterium]MCA6476050.1 anthranilate phosphoribosyltransferase [Chitinophagaceae bacterium]MCA6477770.1 anthranilate phosphoribosyltransferase [Chitinophagaceae bacterium]MCA6479743.1 anthranilate phosphoribosyltransferase [Chitinophagaceae bacterium]MCA6485744.1 anthranilate phosphoribosyltransferase [Chitinophagaceae bacterium]